MASLSSLIAQNLEDDPQKLANLQRVLEAVEQSPSSGLEISSLEALNSTFDPGVYWLNLSEEHPTLEVVKGGLLILQSGPGTERVQVLFIEREGTETVAVRSGNLSGWSDWKVIGSDKINVSDLVDELGNNPNKVINQQKITEMFNNLSGDIVVSATSGIGYTRFNGVLIEV